MSKLATQRQQQLHRMTLTIDVEFRFADTERIKANLLKAAYAISVSNRRRNPESVDTRERRAGTKP
jgi:hypothetical protein